MENDQNPCPESEESDFINLSFRMIVPMSGDSRADEDPNHSEVDSEWSEFEDLIFADDFAFFIYAILSESNEPFLFKVDNFSVLEDPHSVLVGEPNNYTLKVSISKDDFNKVYSESGDDITLKIVAFANTNHNISELTAEDYSTYSNLISSASQKLHYPILGTIYTDTGGRIPMFGVSILETTREVLYKSRPYNPVYGENICMLRSVAKIKVIDNISREESGLPRIEEVSFHSRTNQAYLLPHDAINYVNGLQIETPRPWDDVSSDNSITLTLYNRFENERIGYIPEQGISSEIPYLNITITNELDGKGDPVTASQTTYKVPMKGYNDQTFNFGDNILRNHIYILSVTSVENSEPTLEVAVKQWRIITYEYEY